MHSTAESCTCGNTETHTIAKRLTADGIAVLALSDGSVTGRFSALRGVPVRRPRTPEARAAALRASSLLMGEVELYDLPEVPALYAACERIAKRGGTPGDVRAEMTRTRGAAHPPLTWLVTQTDRDGRPTERQARLPRLLWPGLAIIDYCGGPGSARGRYVLVREIAQGTVATTGFAFATLNALWAHLQS